MVNIWNSSVCGKFKASMKVLEESKITWISIFWLSNSNHVVKKIIIYI